MAVTTPVDVLTVPSSHTQRPDVGVKVDPKPVTAVVAVKFVSDVQTKEFALTDARSGVGVTSSPFTIMI
jgi:hypothetical protein